MCSLVCLGSEQCDWVEYRDMMRLSRLSNGVALLSEAWVCTVTTWHFWYDQDVKPQQTINHNGAKVDWTLFTPGKFGCQDGSRRWRCCTDKSGCLPPVGGVACDLQQIISLHRRHITKYISTMIYSKWFSSGTQLTSLPKSRYPETTDSRFSGRYLFCHWNLMFICNQFPYCV